MADRPGDPSGPGSSADVDHADGVTTASSTASSWSPQVGGGPLFARSWRLAMSAYPAQDAMELVVEVILPRIASLTGFSGGHVLVDRETGDVITTTFWDSLEHLEASAPAAANASVAGQILAENASLASMHVSDVMASLPAPAVADLTLVPPTSPGRPAVEGPGGR